LTSFSLMYASTSEAVLNMVIPSKVLAAAEMSPS